MVILLSGPDTFRSQRRFVQLREAFQTKHDPTGMSTIGLDATEAEASAIRSAVTTQGFFSTKRFVGINHYGAGAVCPPEELADILKPLIESNDMIAVIREVPAEKSSHPKRGPKKKVETLKIPKAKLEDFPSLAPAKLQRWLTQEAKTRGGQLTAPAARQLHDWCGEDMWRLNNELDKLISFAAGQPITPAHVSQLVNAPESSDVFAVVDAVAHQRRADALRLVTQELRAGTNPLALIALLANHLGVLLNIQRLPPGTSASQAAVMLGVHPYVASKGLQQSKKISREKVAALYQQLLMADETVKSTSVDAEALLDVFFARI